MKRAAFCLALAASALSIAGAARYPGPAKTRYVPLEQCASAGGTVKMAGGLGPSPTCVVRNADAGRSCSDSAQCVGRCLARDRDDEGVRAGARTKGMCEPDNATFGCFAEVLDGRATGTLCVD